MMQTRSFGLLLSVLMVATVLAFPSGAVPAGATALSDGFVWTEPTNVSNSTADSRLPALAVDAGGTVHLVWEEGGELYHAYYTEGTVWSSPSRVATGEEPALVSDGSGGLHLAFVNEFGGNYEVYYCKRDSDGWSLPRNVSGTSGGSFSPDLAVADGGDIHVVWADNTPGYNVIYHATSSGGVIWASGPIPNAFGTAPTVGVENAGTVHVAWQDTYDAVASYEVYHSRWDGESWSLPEDVSDTPDAESIAPDLEVSGSIVYLVWQERTGEQCEIYLSSGNTGAWSVPENVSQSPLGSYLPDLVVDGVGDRYLAWDEFVRLLHRQWEADMSAWLPAELIAESAYGLEHVALALAPGGTLYAAWASYDPSGTRDIFSSYRLLEAPTPTPTATLTPTSTPTGTPTASSTPTLTPTPSASPTSKLTSTPTGTPTASSTPTLTPTPSTSPTSTLTATPTTVHVTATPTNTPGVSPELRGLYLPVLFRNFGGL